LMARLMSGFPVVDCWLKTKDSQRGEFSREINP
jgi:hypothetical protein